MMIALLLLAAATGTLEVRATVVRSGEVNAAQATHAPAGAPVSGAHVCSAGHVRVAMDPAEYIPVLVTMTNGVLAVNF